MTRACLVAVIVAAFVAVFAPSKSAHAGGYLGLGIGTSPSLSDERFTPDGRSAKVFIGQRWGQFSLEGGLGGFDITHDPATILQASIAGKLSLPLGDGFEVFGRGGLGHSWLRADKEVNNLEGNGYLLGVGVEYRLDLTVASGSIFIDYTYNKTALDDEAGRGVDLSSRMWTLGLTVGI